MDKQKLEQEKLMLVGQLNAIQEQIDYYWLEAIASNAWAFKELCANKMRIENRIKEIKKILDNN